MRCRAYAKMAGRLALHIKLVLVLPLLFEGQLPLAQQYSPERFYDLKSLRLEVIPNFETRTIEGYAAYKLQPLCDELKELSFDAVDLDITNVVVNGQPAVFSVSDTHLKISLTQPISESSECSVEIFYKARPKRGLYFRTPDLGYPTEDTHLFTQGEATDSRYWLPCYDAPDDRFVSELICWVPPGMIAISNGRLIETIKDGCSGRIGYHWMQDKPHVTYLIALVAGYFEGIETNWHGIRVSFYAPRTLAAYIQNSFEGTLDMLSYFEEVTGTPYPWDKYAQVCVRDFVAGGMENTSLTVLTHRTLHPDTLRQTRSSRSLVAHELAHQWFGDLVTCEDWTHLWLNEGFATYFENLYQLHWQGVEEFLYQLWNDAQTVFRQTNDLRPIVWRGYKDPDEQFDYRSYAKAGWVLHMIHTQIGERKWRQLLRRYLTLAAYKTVETADFKRILEELTGRQWDQFFDQWLYQGGFPILEVDYEWNEQKQSATIKIRQQQAQRTNGPLFRFPLKIRFGTSDLLHTVVEHITEKEQLLSIHVPFKPEWVRFDPDLELLACIKANLPKPTWEKIAHLRQDPIGRLIAIETLAEKDPERSIDLLSQTLRHDPFYGVRIRAAKLLSHMSRLEAWEALASAVDDPDPRVQLAVWEQLQECYLPTIRQLVLKRFLSCTNLDVQAAMLRCLKYWQDDETRQLVFGALSTQSFGDILANAALDVIGAWDEPSDGAVVFQWLKVTEPALEVQTKCHAIKTVAQLASGVQDKKQVLNYLLSLVTSPQEAFRIAAVESLGLLKDKEALTVLRSLASKTDSPRLVSAAKEAIEKIQKQEEKQPSQSILKRLESLEERVQRLEQGKQKAATEEQASVN